MNTNITSNAKEVFDFPSTNVTNYLFVLLFYELVIDLQKKNIYIKSWSAY